MSGKYRNTNSVVVYRGPSMIDPNQGIILVLSGLNESANGKTGALIQSYIISENCDPVTAIRNGSNLAVCGDCPQNPALGGGCYVNEGQAPLSLYRGIERGNIPYLPLSAIAHLLRGRQFRIGSYGDPAAVPVSVWEQILDATESNHNGYTHQWRKRQYQALRTFCMASVETAQEAIEAQAMGWRTFRVRNNSYELLPTEIVCPASLEGGYRRQCADCMACDGNPEQGNRRSVAIIVHGNSARSSNARRVVERKTLLSLQTV